jgi:Helix-hairpin-helix motif
MKPKTRIGLVLVMMFALSGMLVSAQEGSNAKVNINTATQEELAHLPGMTKRKAAKVIAGRPYTSADDLSKSGLTSKQIDKIKPLITYEGSAAAAAAATTGASSAPSKPEHQRNTHSTTSTQSASAESASAQTPPQPGMVWANPKSKIYHVEGDRYYGKTKNGEWMTEADAIKAGYHKSKQHVKND